MGSAITILRAAAVGDRILSGTGAEPRGAVFALRIWRLPLSNGAPTTPDRRTVRARFVRQSSGLGCAPSEMGLWRLGEPRIGTSTGASRQRLGLRQLRMLVAAPNLRQPSR